MSHLIIDERRGNVFMDPPLELVTCAHCCACNTVYVCTSSVFMLKLKIFLDL